VNTTASRNAGVNVMAFAFAIGQRVKISAIDTVGFVRGITVTSDGIDYRVAYFDDDKVRREEWLSEHEIARITG
jgi:hypothetical protein